jgi:hypothetical protein
MRLVVRRPGRRSQQRGSSVRESSSPGTGDPRTRYPTRGSPSGPTTGRAVQRPVFDLADVSTDRSVSRPEVIAVSGTAQDVSEAGHGDGRGIAVSRSDFRDSKTAGLDTIGCALAVQKPDPHITYCRRRLVEDRQVDVRVLEPSEAGHAGWKQPPPGRAGCPASEMASLLRSVPSAFATKIR